MNNNKIVVEAQKLTQKVHEMINKFVDKYGMIPVLNQDFAYEVGSALPTMSLIMLEDIRMAYKKNETKSRGDL